MKQAGLLILSIIISFTQIEAQTNKSKVDMAFDKTANGITAHDFGSIVFGANGKVDFVYTNQGTKPLIITKVESSCGCTTPTWTKEPVEPGKKGTVTIVYNTTLPGIFNKTVVVTSNANNSPVRLEVRGKVNTQASDLKPNAIEGPAKDKAIMLEKDEQSLPHDGIKKKIERQPVNAVISAPKTGAASGTPVTKSSVTGTKK